MLRKLLHKKWFGWTLSAIPAVVFSVKYALRGEYIMVVVMILSWILGYALAHAIYDFHKKLAQRKTYGNIITWIPLKNKAGEITMHWARVPATLPDHKFEWIAKTADLGPLEAVNQTMNQIDDQTISLMEIWEDDGKGYPRWANDVEMQFIWECRQKQSPQEVNPILKHAFTND